MNCEGSLQGNQIHLTLFLCPGDFLNEIMFSTQNTSSSKRRPQI